ncbi:DUF1492 domain-containing protein [Ligilactobacillus ruminis]|uniref:DUF1492 domain-containing protein n=1 Tax=Ligilactobacillus ruminis TaxID=1623 RepID=UPI001F2FB75D|nr:DUF1492 domain-containing protein [Ligilactobacillus ruminis]MCF2544252.1 DUF1492 domain-containing protein [Ligilactobacillus ruminis]
MTPQQYLNQAKHLDALINVRLREIDYWKDMSTNISGIKYDAMPKNPNATTDAYFVRCLDKICEIQQDVEKKVRQLIVLRDEISSRIDLLTNPEEQLVLRYRYIDNCTWDEIASMLNASLRTVYRIHGAALQNFSVPS